MITQTIERYIETFGASQYLIQLSHNYKQLYNPIRVSYTPEQLLKSIAFLRHKNAIGYNVYARPIGYEFILLDDLKREVLADLATIKPCLLIETSPNNYQAFITLSQVPNNRENALLICRQLAQMYKADPGSAEPDHLGRLPGFRNRKEKYKNKNGIYPLVILHKAEKRISTFIPQWGACAKNISANRTLTLGNDRSRQDFNFVCMLIRQGKSDTFINDALLKYSQKAQERGEKYIFNTIQNAKKALQ